MPDLNVPDLNVMVTFFSRTGTTERLGLAAALGAVNARAKIRLRWLREEVDDPALDAVPGWRENRERMLREYIAPREIDVLWADAMMLAAPTEQHVASPEVSQHLRLLRELHGAGKLHGKVATAFTVSPRSSDRLMSLCGALADLDLLLVPPALTSTIDPTEAARIHGRRVAERARDMKKT